MKNPVAAHAPSIKRRPSFQLCEGWDETKLTTNWYELHTNSRLVKIALNNAKLTIISEQEGAQNHRQKRMRAMQEERGRRFLHDATKVSSVL